MMMNRPQPGKAGSASRDPFWLNLTFLNMQGYRMNEVPADSTTLKPNRGPEFSKKILDRMESAWTALLALAYPAIYVVPASIIRLVLAGEIQQQIARCLYVAGLVLASDRVGRGAGPPAGWGFLEHNVVSFGPGGFSHVLLFGVCPVLCLFAGSIYGNQLPAKRSTAEVVRDLIASPTLAELVFRALLFKWLVVSRGVESMPKLCLVSPAVRTGHARSESPNRA